MFDVLSVLRNNATGHLPIEPFGYSRNALRKGRRGGSRPTYDSELSMSLMQTKSDKSACHGQRYVVKQEIALQEIATLFVSLVKLSETRASRRRWQMVKLLSGRKWNRVVDIFQKFLY